MSTPTTPPVATKQLAEHYDYLAPDGSEIRVLLGLSGGGLAHCTLPAGGVSRAVVHQTVEEIWYCLTGAGEVWREQGSHATVVSFRPGTCLTIPLGTRFQFRTVGPEPLSFLIATMPPWPGEHEAQPVPGHWKVEAGTKSDGGRA